MEYYVYSSKAKIDMLFSQMPESDLDSVSHKLGFDLKLLNVSRETTRSPNKPNIVQMKLVEQYIRDNKKVGDFESDALWIATDIEAKLVRFDEGSIAFVGRCGNTIFSLGGSEVHLSAGACPHPARAGASYLPDIAHWIAALDLHLPSIVLDSTLEKTSELISGGMGQGFAGWINVIEQAYARSTAPIARLKHFSRRLDEGFDGATQRQFVLATPLYVALAD